MGRIRTESQGATINADFVVQNTKHAFALYTDDDGSSQRMVKIANANTVKTTAGDLTVDPHGGNFMIEKDTPAATAVTLPATPVLGSEVAAYDSGGDAGTQNVTVDRNGATIDGAAADKVIAVAHGFWKGVYVGGATGWRTIAELLA